VPVTSFKRLLGTPAVRAKVGLDLKDGNLVFLAEPKHIAKALLFIADELASGRTKTEDIYTQKKRIKYANNLPPEIVVKHTIKDGRPIQGGKKPKTTPKPKRHPARDILIPRDCVLSIPAGRIYDIETELRSLSLDTYANAVSVLFRVFVELSMDAYNTTKSLSVSDDAALAVKMEAVLNDLLSKQKLTKIQAAPVRTAMEKNTFLAPTVMMMHKYVHNQYVFPAAGDLRAYWNNLQPFMTAVWSP
jgi:hypothetical protein